MKKIIIYIIVLLLVSFISISGTYAFFTAITQLENAVNIQTHQLLVKYAGDEAISGGMQLVTSKEEGFKRNINISLDEKSLSAVANIFIYIEEITEGLQSKALKWEIYELINGEEQHIQSGNFINIKPNSTNYIAKDITLSTTNREFVVYLWLNGNEAGNEVIDAKLVGYIGADTSTISGELSDKK